MNKVIIFLVVVLLLGAGGYSIFTRGDKELSSQNQQPLTTENKIVIKDFIFDPATLTVKKGITVIWTNEDDVPHKIKSGTFNFDIINKGDSFQFKFDNVGTYDYTCSIHPTMKGEIIVQD